ncbi:MAG TPA: hypothetical protein PKL60_04945 [Anaerolineaceae bacterium]|nr:hypothetical protein [Anaerolineaceae bacterium]
MAQALTLPSIFKAVSKTLSENEAALNEADTYNHNHGSNMAKAFTTVSKAVAKKKDLPVSEQLTYASKVLQDSTSSSAKIYAQGLANAAQKFQGKQLNENTVGLLIDSMMGIQEPAQAASGAAEKSLLGSLLGGLAGGQQQQQQTQPSGGDLLGSLLGGLAGGQQQQQTQPSGGDLLGSLLGGLAGGQQQQQTQPSGGDLLGSLLGGQSNPDNGLDITDLLSAGLSYYSAKEQGGSTMEAIMQALASASPLGQRDDQKQSGALVINTILNMLKKKKK